MTPIKVELKNVSYNATTQTFEALATLHDSGQRHSYARIIEAPITMEFADASRRLSRQAFRLHRMAGRMPFVRAGRAALSSKAPLLARAA